MPDLPHDDTEDKPDLGAEADATVASDAVTPSVVLPPVTPVDTGYTSTGVPTFDSVREKIETRYGTAIGAAELAAETPEGRTAEENFDARQKAAAERLEQIKASMHKQEPGSD